MRFFITIFLVVITTNHASLPGWSGQKKPPGAHHFTAMPSGKNGVHFNNQITESDSVNVYKNEYKYNGTGVGIGDFNTDIPAAVFFAVNIEKLKVFTVQKRKDDYFF